MKILTGIPFFRICIPFIAGILLAVQFECACWWLMFPSFALAVILAFVKRQNFAVKTTLLLSIDVFLLSLGMQLVQQTRITNTAAYYGNKIEAGETADLIAAVNSLPVYGEKFIKCDLKILEVKSGNEFVAVEGSVKGYIRKTKQHFEIQPGQAFFIHAKLNEVDAPKNPFEFDYKNYLERKQVHHVFFADSSSFVPIDAPGHISQIWETGLKLKQHILASLKNSGLNDTAFAISAALLTGYDDEISQSVMEAFSHSGTLHVLSVSGLHTGLIYLVLSFLFDAIDRKKRFKLGKFIFITICLWAFALITGFSAPVLRAVIMFNLLGFGKIFFRNSARHQINVLLVSAFILLCYNPFLIVDIGFQLSYFALAGILFFQPVFENMWRPENRAANYVWQSVTASFAATLSTLPFTLFYFKQFPIWFFVCNLVVVPLTFVVLLLAVLLILKINVAVLVNALVQFLCWFIQLFNSGTGGYIDTIDFTFIDSLCMFAVIVFVSAALYYRSFRYCVYSLLCIIVWQINGITASYLAKDEKLFSVYHVKNESVCAVKNKTRVTIDSVSHLNFNYHIRPHLVSFNNPMVETRRFNFVSKPSGNILILDKPRYWPQVDVSGISILVISNGFKLSEADFEQFKKLKLVVADGSNNTYSVNQLAGLCSKFGIEFYSTRKNGAYREYF